MKNKRHSWIGAGLAVSLAFCAATVTAADVEVVPADAPTAAPVAADAAVEPTAAAKPAESPAQAAATDSDPQKKQVTPHQQDLAKKQPPAGWKAMTKGSVVYWCTEDPVMGTRARRELRCLTPDQYELTVIYSQKSIEDIRKSMLPPKGG